MRASLLEQVAPVQNLFNVDAWDGAPAARDRLFRVIQRSGARNPIVLTGDIHSAWGANLLRDFSDPESPIVAAEFVCTSVTSDFIELDPRPGHAVVRTSVLADNPHITYFNGLYRGYCLCDVDAQRFQTTYRAIGTPADVALPDPLALVPRAGSPASDDAVLEIAAGFTDPRVNGRIETRAARPIPL